MDVVARVQEWYVTQHQPRQESAGVNEPATSNMVNQYTSSYATYGLNGSRFVILT